MIDTIVVFGSTGMLGRYIVSYFRKHTALRVIPISRKDYSVDINNWNTLEKLFESYSLNNHSCVINCIGCIPQRYTHTDSSLYYNINALFPHILASMCTKYNVNMIQPTTDCVFSGMRGMYTESDYADEVNHYGRSKSIGEPLSASVLRVSILGEELENKKSFLEWVRTSKSPIQGWTNHMWNGITCLQYCKIVETICEKNLFWKGVRHILSPNPVSKYELACFINQAYGLQLEIKPITCMQSIDKTLASTYSLSNDLCIPTIDIQINELKTFSLEE